MRILLKKSARRFLAQFLLSFEFSRRLRASADDGHCRPTLSVSQTSKKKNARKERKRRIFLVNKKKMLSFVFFCRFCFGVFDAHDRMFFSL